MQASENTSHDQEPSSESSNSSWDSFDFFVACQEAHVHRKVPMWMDGHDEEQTTQHVPFGNQYYPDELAAFDLRLPEDPWKNQEQDVSAFKYLKGQYPRVEIRGALFIKYLAIERARGFFESRVDIFKPISTSDGIVGSITPLAREIGIRDPNVFDMRNPLWVREGAMVEVGRRLDLWLARFPDRKKTFKLSPNAKPFVPGSTTNIAVGLTVAPLSAGPSMNGKIGEIVRPLSAGSSTSRRSRGNARAASARPSLHADCGGFEYARAPSAGPLENKGIQPIIRPPWEDRGRSPTRRDNNTNQLFLAEQIYLSQIAENVKPNLSESGSGDSSQDNLEEEAPQTAESPDRGRPRLQSRDSAINIRGDSAKSFNNLPDADILVKDFAYLCVDDNTREATSRPCQTVKSKKQRRETGSSRYEMMVEHTWVSITRQGLK